MECKRKGCMGYARGGLCPACAKRAVLAEMRAAGWSESLIAAALAPNARVEEFMALSCEGEKPLPPQGEA